MPTLSVFAGAFAGVYVGNYGSNSKLTQVMGIRTEGTTILESLPTSYTPLLKAREQVGNHAFNFNLKFYENQMATRLAKGIDITADINLAPGQAQYQLFLVHPNYNDKLSWFFPRISVEVEDEHGAYKDNAGVTTVKFIAEDPSVFYIEPNTGMKLGTQETVHNLIVAMGGLAPFSY